jgi:predicted DNA binding CopG/RHH family protein
MNKKKIKLTNQEKRIEKALEKGKFVKTPDFKQTKKMFKEAVENFRELTKTKRITIRVKNEDLIKVKARARRNNVPYQTLLNALIRQFVEGKTVVQF